MEEDRENDDAPRHDEGQDSDDAPQAGSEDDSGGGTDVPEVEEAVKEMDSDLSEMADEADELGEGIDKTRGDWESRQQDSGVPGAEPSDDDD